jgi:hypothetical protein
MNRPRAADDFEVIRERLEQLRRERAEIENTNQTGNSPPEGTGEDGERQRQERCEGAPPAWVPTIFLPQPTD